MLSNHKPTYAVTGSMLPSGAKMVGNQNEAQVSSFVVEDPENCSGDQKKSGRDKSLSLQQITKGITLKTKVSNGKIPK